MSIAIRNFGQFAGGINVELDGELYTLDEVEQLMKKSLSRKREYSTAREKLGELDTAFMNYESVSRQMESKSSGKNMIYGLGSIDAWHEARKLVEEMIDEL